MATGHWVKHGQSFPACGIRQDKSVQKHRIIQRLITAHQCNKRSNYSHYKNQDQMQLHQGGKRIRKRPLVYVCQSICSLTDCQGCRGGDMLLSKLSRQQVKPGSSLQDTSDHSGGINLILMPQCFNYMVSLHKQLLHAIRARLITVPVSGKLHTSHKSCEERTLLTIVSGTGQCVGSGLRW